MTTMWAIMLGSTHSPDTVCLSLSEVVDRTEGTKITNHQRHNLVVLPSLNKQTRINYKERKEKHW